MFWINVNFILFFIERYFTRYYWKSWEKTELENIKKKPYSTKRKGTGDKNMGLSLFS